MNLPILARDARVGERNVRQESCRKLPSAGPESWRAKFLATTLAAPMLALAILLSSGTGGAANAGCEGAYLRPTGNLTRIATAHGGGTYCRDTLGATKIKTHDQLIASRHKAWSLERPS
jgi:hypothetical protein